VFNFNVGDTFDYKQTSFNQCVGFFEISYLRKVVVQKSYSINQDTIYYQYSLSYGNGLGGNQFLNVSPFDTITNLDSFAIYLTEPLLSTGNSAGCVSRNYDTTFYFGYASDSIGIGCFESRDFFRYTNRLGMTYYNLSGGGDPCGSNGNTYELIHFANDSMHFGYDVLDGFFDLSKISNAYLYPTSTHGLFHLSFPDAGLHSAYLILTDLLGQQVYSSPITGSETTHDISYLSSGLYTWRIISDNATIKTGKIIKQ
jgi:hypothetical protein